MRVPRVLVQASSERRPGVTPAIEPLLRQLDIHPILVDVGASAGPPAIWQPLAGRSTYVGFDPDRRDFPDAPAGGYARALIVPEAVVVDAAQAQAHFYLTRSPYCSSTLAPDTGALDDYAFAGEFEVEGEASVPATTLEAVLARYQLPGIDWLKLDTQGTDLRLFES